MSIESNGYVATVGDIKELMQSRLNAIDITNKTGQTYMRALIATAQKRLRISYVASRRGARPRIDNVGHLVALKQVHGEFYEGLTAVIEASAEDKDGNRLGFARSAYSTVRNWLLLGKKDLTQLNPLEVTKHGLANTTPKRDKPSNKARRLFKRASVVKRTQDVLKSIIAASKYTREEALAALHDCVVILSRGFDDMGIDAQPLRVELEHASTSKIPPIPIHKPIRRANGKEQRRAA